MFFEHLAQWQQILSLQHVFGSLSSIWCIIKDLEEEKTAIWFDDHIISLKAVRNPFCFLQGLRMQIRVTLLFSEMFWKPDLVCEIPISTGSCWDFPYQLDSQHFNWTSLATPRLVYVGACNGNLWPSGQGGDGGWLVRKWLLFWESPSSTYLEGIKQAANVW